MDQKDLELLQAVITTLDGVPVSGRDNLSKVLGCINVLQEMLERNSPKKEEEQK